MRREFSSKIRVAAFERSKGKCEKCTARLMPGKFIYDHIIPDALGGEPTLENCQVLCSTCDDTKTDTQDIPAIAKVKRIRAKHIGAKQPSRFPGAKNSKWKQKIGGGWELRARSQERV